MNFENNHVTINLHTPAGGNLRFGHLHGSDRWLCHVHGDDQGTFFVFKFQVARFHKVILNIMFGVPKFQICFLCGTFSWNPLGEKNRICTVRHVLFHFARHFAIMNTSCCSTAKHPWVNMFRPNRRPENKKCHVAPQVARRTSPSTPHFPLHRISLHLSAASEFLLPSPDFHQRPA